MRIYFVLLSLFEIALFSSCSKEYNCQCVTKNSADSSINIVVDEPLTGKKSDVKVACEKKSLAFGTITKTCKLN
jgi:hypothetical protein